MNDCGIIFVFFLLTKESTKYFEDGEGFVYKKVNENENEKTVYYDCAIEERYKSIWLPENHRTKFLPVLRRLRNYHKVKPEKSGCAEPKSKDAACSPIVPPNQIQVGALITPSLRSKTPIPLNRHSNCKATTSKDQCGAAMSSDMATSPMPNMNTRCEQNEATPTGTGNSIDGRMEASVI